MFDNTGLFNPTTWRAALTAWPKHWTAALMTLALGIVAITTVIGYGKSRYRAGVADQLQVVQQAHALVRDAHELAALAQLDAAIAEAACAASNPSLAGRAPARSSPE